MKLKELIDSINEDLTYSAYEMQDDNKEWIAKAYIILPSGQIEIYVKRDCADVDIVHNVNEHKSPNIEKYISDKISIDWEKIDNWSIDDDLCKEGLDPAFASWEDYNNYKYR